MPGRFELTSTLAKIWHAPDHFRLLDPLPPMHRRGIIAGFLLVISVFCFPPMIAKARRPPAVKRT